MNFINEGLVMNNISANDYHRLQWQQAQLSFHKTDGPDVFKLNNDDAVKSPNAIENIRGGDRISNIKPEDIEALYAEIKAGSITAIEASNIKNEKLEPFDYLQHNIKEIGDYPIEVSIEPDEVNTAILFNSLGINFLDVKRMEVRMELYEKAKEDVKNSSENNDIRKDQELALMEDIDNRIADLKERKQDLMERKKITESEDELFNQLRFKHPDSET